MNKKQCTGCKKELLATTEFFNKNRAGKFGMDSQCRPCRAEYRRLHRQKNKHKTREYSRINRDKIAEYHKEYMSNPENKKKKSEYLKDWYKKNSERLKKQGAEYYNNNKAAAFASTAKRRATKLNQTPEYANLELIKRIYNHCPEGYHVEHMNPITRGGLHHESNLCYLPAHTNLSKNNKTIEEFGQEEFHAKAIYWQDIIF